MRILFISANPDWTPRLDLLDELRELKQSLKGKNYTLEFLPAAQPEDLRDAVDGNSADIDILHFTGHGTRIDGLLFRQSNGRKVAIKASDLNKIFSNKPVKLAVLNACHTQETAEGITGFANTTIGTTGKLHEVSAKKLTKVLYAALGNGKSIDDAFEEATQTLETTGLQNIYEPYRSKGKKPEKIEFDSGDIKVDPENEDAWNRYFFEGYLKEQIESVEETIEQDRKWAWWVFGLGAVIAAFLLFRYNVDLKSGMYFFFDMSEDAKLVRTSVYEDWVNLTGEHMLASITKYGNILGVAIAGLAARLVVRGNTELRSLTKLLELVKSSAEMPANMRDKLFSIVEQNMFGALTVTEQDPELEEGAE